MSIRIFAIDFETSGKSTKTNFATEVAIVCLDMTIWNSHNPHNSVIDVFHSYIRRPEHATWEKRCVDQFWKTLPDKYEQTLQVVESPNTPSIEQVGMDIMEWMNKYKSTQNIIVSDNGPFDFTWLNHILPPDTSLHYLFDQEKYNKHIICLRSLKMGISDPLQFPPWDVSNTHDPRDDARFIAFKFAYILGTFNSIMFR